MSRSTRSDRRYLEWKDGKWRVTVPVPRKLHAQLGTKLKEPLKTDSLMVANLLKWPVVARLKKRIEAAQRGDGSDPIAAEALALARELVNARSDHEAEQIDTAISVRTEDLQGPVIGEHFDPETGEPLPAFDPERERLAGRFSRIAYGRETPLLLHHAAYLSKADVKRRTAEDDRRAVRYLVDWCAAESLSPSVETMTRKRAGVFMDALPSLIGTGSPRTVNKYHGRLRRYWQWLVDEEHVETNVWVGRSMKVKPTPANEKERAFTDEEMQRLLYGPASEPMHALMRIAALTGARLDAVADLKVRDCADGQFRFKPQKKEVDFRDVPIHSALQELVQRLCEDRAPEDDLFPEYPPPKDPLSQRERSFKASNDFTVYRREVGVDEVLPGRRRSLVNFHSFRRWFVTKAERADQPVNIIASVVGHSRDTQTEKYSRGVHREQMRRCVEAVQLPPPKQ